MAELQVEVEPDVSLHVTFDDAGAGRWAFLLAGMATQSTMWEPPFVSRLVERGISAVRFDWRDIGRSTWRSYREHPYGPDTFVSDVFAVADAIDAHDVDIVGFSMGGCIAQIAALTRPDRIRTLTTLSSGFASPAKVDRPPRGDQLMAMYALARPADEGEVRSRLLEQWRLMYGQGVEFDEAAWGERIRSWIERGQNPSCPHMRMRDEILGTDRTPAFAQLEVPTLVLHGLDDPMFPHGHGCALADAVPNATLELLAGRGHDLPFDPEIANRIADHILAN